MAIWVKNILTKKGAFNRNSTLNYAEKSVRFKEPR
jgi:hypothetical protein